MAAEAESLDVRMEAIRLKNEELEKKHKEILEDEENAKRENAVVDVNSGRDIPKAHPYDNIDLDFDVKDKDKELTKNPDYQPKNRRPMPRKELLDEIPPDPVNFLREDGDEAPKSETPQTQRPPNNKNFRNNNRNQRPRPERSNNESEAPLGDSPNRTRNLRPRPQQQQQNQQQQQYQNRSPQDGNVPKRQTPPSQLRNERRSAPQQSYEQQSPTGPPQQSSQPNRQRRPINNRPPNREGGDRNNITVQVSDGSGGEVRSVKLRTQEKTFGTGRVGGNRPDNVQKFTVDIFDPENTGAADHHQHHQQQQMSDHSPSDKPRNRNPRNNRRNPRPKEFQHPTLENIVIPKASVQDRLLKIAKDPITEPQVEVPVVANDSNNGN